MPNWCITTIEIVNPNSEAIEKLESEFKNAFQWNKIENGFGDGWLGNILGYLGYDAKDICYGNINCRGEIVCMERTSNMLRIDTDTAWTPMLEPFKLMVKKYAPKSEITYYAVEAGCCIYCTNDINMVGTIYVDVFDSLPDELSWLEEMNYSYMKKSEFMKNVAESMGWDIPENEIEDKIKEEFSDSFSYSEWEYCNISEW